MTNNLTGYHSQAHFKANDLELYYNFPVQDSKFHPCHHIEKLSCSKASKLTPEECESKQHCLLLKYKEKLFRPLGIHGPTLKEIDNLLRNKTQKNSE